MRSVGEGAALEVDSGRRSQAAVLVSKGTQSGSDQNDDGGGDGGGGEESAG